MKLSEIKENSIIAFDALKANKLRSILASLGVVIGISTVILMGWILSGLQAALDETFQVIGVDVIYIDKWDWTGGKNWKEVRYRKNITLEQVNELRNKLETAELTFPSSTIWMRNIKFENEVFNGINITGTSYEHGLTPTGETLLGRYFTPYEQSINSNVVVIGYKVYETMFKDKYPINQTIKINGIKFNIVGVIKKQGTLWLDFIDNQVFIPIGTFLKLYGNNNRNISIGIKAGSESKLDLVREEARGLMRLVRNLKPYDEDDFSINETKAFERQTQQLKLYVWGIGLALTVLSFIVGIIGIMNIMFVSVTERTKEIGIRKALGAKKSSILFQFIFESSLLSFVGAIVSLIICSVLVYLVSLFIVNQMPNLAFLKPYLPFNLLIIASLVSIFVGILAGLIPAIKASNLNPVDALRFE